MLTNKIIKLTIITLIVIGYKQESFAKLVKVGDYLEVEGWGPLAVSDDREINLPLGYKTYVPVDFDTDHEKYIAWKNEKMGSPKLIHCIKSLDLPDDATCGHGYARAKMKEESYFDKWSNKYKLRNTDGYIYSNDKLERNYYEHKRKLRASGL